MNDPPSSERKNMAIREMLAENMRLAYVALTRAKARCYLGCGFIGSAGFSAMAYLLGEGLSDEEGIQQLATAWKDMDNEQIRERLVRLQEEGCGCAVYPMPDEAGTSLEYMESARQPRLELPAFTRVMDQRCGISSFSSLVRGREHPARSGFDEPVSPAREAFTEASEPVSGAVLGEAERPEEYSFFTFPKGPGPGSMLHEILEHLDFAHAESKVSTRLIREKLQRYGMEATWLPVVQEAMLQITETELGEGFALCEVSETLPEMEFYYPLKPITSQALAHLYREWNHSLPEPFSISMERLHFAPRQGFMLGFIDLVFRHKGKWYLVDWKSNHLGNNFAAYHKDKLVQAMSDNMYFFQSHIYTVALDAYLKQRLPNTYNYQEHFGGILYLFLRGMHKKYGPEYGVHAEQPDAGFIEALSACLLG